MDGLDRDHIDAMVAMVGRPRLRELADEFALDTARFLAALDEAHGRADRAAIVELAHRLAGLAGLFGASRLAADARLVETLPLGPDLDGVIAGLRPALAAATAAIRNHLER